MDNTLANLVHGFGIALQPHNFLFSLVGVLIGNLIGVLPGMGIMATISILLPLTFGMPPVAAILMLAGIYYGAQYGGAICSILLNLPCHPSHAVTCLDGYPMTRQGRGGVALGITMLAAFFGAAFGIVQMILFAPFLVQIAFKFGPAEICTLMLLGLLAGATLARGSALKGVAMTLVGIVLGSVGSDLDIGTSRFTFGSMSLYNGIDLVAVALGFFGIAEFLKSINTISVGDLSSVKVRMRDMRPSRADLREAAMPILRGTLVGSLCSLIPGTGPTIASFIAYAAEKRVSRNPEKFGRGAIAGVASPEASTHSSVQGDFVPTMSLGIPGDAVMALILGALIIQGITPGPQLMTEHPDMFWGLIASFWIGNILLVVLNVPLIGVWVKLLRIPFRYLYPCALFFICVGVYSTNNEMAGVIQTLVIGVVGYGLMRLGFHPAPVLLGFVLGPRLEENFRRALMLSRGDLTTFVDSPISATFVGLAVVLVAAQVYLARKARVPRIAPQVVAGRPAVVLEEP
ncbi:tripartite tricarboxylate transporter permease [Methylobacterium currus]|uniref:tripartite tricarboxylate transporter permease n=1 Tax=Methylobacterium currus TaxID=2051553 RepID=UPI001E47629B|nr:tripartite tricarboxylate transporter permease [Methylobacterium currus]UHC19550.1 tripartite tricarboxylate transporter permease [Methylobacterium currus]